jgi:predicted enzyme related to lactoylglutathione lyase
VHVQFVASVSPIVRDRDHAKAFYESALGLTFEGGERDYVFTERLSGVRHFGLWPLSEAAKACFGAPEWPENVSVPQASVEFEVEDVAAAARELEQQGYQLIHGAKTEPWGQVTARLLSPEGLLVAVCYTPWFHEGDARAERPE